MTGSIRGTAIYRYGIGIFEETRGTTKSYYHADTLGTTSTVTDSSATVTATYDRDAFGYGGTSTGSAATPFGFAGQSGYQTDADSGLMLLGHRYYDPLTGRFLSRDPAQDAYNWYTYCANDPVNSADPSGLHPPGARHVTIGDPGLDNYADGKGSPMWVGIGELPKPVIDPIKPPKPPIKNGTYPITIPGIGVHFNDPLAGSTTGDFTGEATVVDGKVVAIDGQISIRPDVYDFDVRPKEGWTKRNILTWIGGVMGDVMSINQYVTGDGPGTPKDFPLYIDGTLPYKKSF